MALRTLALALAPLAALSLAAPAAAAPRADKPMPERSKGAEVHVVDLDPLNESGVEGKAILVQRDGTLKVTLIARGVVPGMLHPQHIHGLAGSKNATCPTREDAGEDGVLTLLDGLDDYGPVLLELTPFPMAPHGIINYHQTFDIDVDDLTDLSDEAIVVHGGFVNGEYVPTLPVACGEIDPES